MVGGRRAPRAPEARIRGQAIHSALSAFSTLHGADAMKQVVASLPEPIGPTLRDAELKTAGWYPLPWLRIVHRVAREVSGEDVTLSRKLGFAATQADARGIYNPLLSFVDPSQLFRHAERVLELYVEGPAVTVHFADRGHAEATFEAMNGADESIWMNILGATEGLISLAGGIDATAAVIGGGGDEPRAVIGFSWS